MVEVQDTASDRFALRDYLRVLRRRWLLVALSVLLAVGGSIAYSLLQTPRYVAWAEVLVEPTASDVNSSGTPEVTAEEMSTQVQVVTSVPVAKLVQKRLGLVALPELTELVTAEPLGTSRIVRITGSATRPAVAAVEANAVATAYLRYRGTQAARQFQDAASDLSARQSAVEDRIDAIDQVLLEDPRNRVELESERRGLLTQLGQIASQIASVDQSVVGVGGGGTILHRAIPPAGPVSPRPLLNGVLAAVIGLVLGVGLALLRDRFDEVVHDEEAVRRALGRAPVLGRIPHWDEVGNKSRLVTLMYPHAVASEAFQSLSVNVRFLLAAARRPAHRAGVVMTTSAQPEEGKTVTAANLAVAAARVGMRVVLVDADLRRGRAAERFGLGDDVPGLSDLLASDDDVPSSLVDVGVENLLLLPAGTIPPNPTELLASPRMRMVLQEIASNADLVVLDTPPALLVADTLELVSAVDLSIVVARRGVSHRRAIASVVERLRQVGAESIGGVVNCIDSEDGTKAAAYSYAPATTGRQSAANTATLGSTKKTARKTA
jgi:polysaccharide biosynthesis transport protein